MLGFNMPNNLEGEIGLILRSGSNVGWWHYKGQGGGIPVIEYWWPSKGEGIGID